MSQKEDLKDGQEIPFSQECWDSGYGPLDSEFMEAHGLRELGDQPVDDTVLGRYIDQDRQVWEAHYSQYLKKYTIHRIGIQFIGEVE